MTTRPPGNTSTRLSKPILAGRPNPFGGFSSCSIDARRRLRFVIFGLLLIAPQDGPRLIETRWYWRLVCTSLCQLHEVRRGKPEVALITFLLNEHQQNLESDTTIPGLCVFVKPDLPRP